MASVLWLVVGWIGETVIKNLMDKVSEVIQGGEISRKKIQGGEGGECGVTALHDLNNSLRNIQPIITQTENMWIKDRDLRKNVNELVVQLKDAAYDAEDLLDKFEFQKLQQQIKQQGNEASDTSSSSSFLSFLSRPVKKRKVVEYNDHDDVAEIRKIREKLDNIRDSMDKLLSTDTRGKVPMINEINRVTSSIPVETQVFGRDRELNELISFLLEPDQGGSRSTNISILTITGLGGVGKTTLAQEAYNDQRVEEYFELRMWVCVSENFSVERLTKEIIESATKQKYDPSNFDALQGFLKEKTTRKKFLLVFDDVWNEDRCMWDRHMWDTLCAPLRSGATGSKILVTTRDEKIANMVGSMNPIHLNGLDDENSWALFKKYAFGPQNSRDHPQLEDIAKNMVPMLKGLPLAARTLGGLLNKKMNEQHWRTIMHSEIWKLEENRVLSVLQLSYQYLPAYLKRCFAFCSLYPKDYIFDEHELVRIWMAEGFFPPQENITMEDFGSDCFQELVSRSFFQKSQYPKSYVMRLLFQKSQHPNRYVMHDLVHDLAELISGEETYRLDDGKPFEIPTMLRHLNRVTTTVDEGLSIMESHDFHKLRTLIYQSHNNVIDISMMNPVWLCGFFNRLQSIRILILRDCELRELPETIGDFIHLRYLDVSQNFLEKLPNSLCKLYNLQALILQSCLLKELPDSIGNLFYLWYLDISHNRHLNKLPESLCHLSHLQTLNLYGCWALQSLPQGTSRLANLRKLHVRHLVEIPEVRKLTSLQSLSIFKVGKEHGLKLAELSSLTQLHETLRITNLENVESKEEAIAAKLHSKEHLDGLVLEWTKNDAFSDTEEEVLEHLRPNPTVKILIIKGYNGARSPSWLEEQSLSKLETLFLEDCKRWDDLPFIRFPCLSVLKINNLPLLNRLPLLPPSLTRLILDKVGLIEFPGIQEGMGESSSNIVSPIGVWISECPNLTRLDGIECFPCLKSLDIKDCPLLTWLPPLPPSLVKPEIIEVGLTELPGIGGSSSNIAIISPLKMQMQIRGCPNLTSLDIIDFFTCLKYLDIEDCPLVTRLPPLPPSLVEIKLSRVGLTELSGIGGSSSNIAIRSPLEIQMQIRGCPNLTSLDIIDCFPCLKYLDIEACPLLTRLPPLPPSLVELNLIKVGLTELSGVGGSSSNIAIVSPLKMQIRGCPNLTSLDRIDCFPCLKSLDIEYCPLLTRLSPLPPSLVELKLTEVGLTELSGVGGSSSNKMQIRGCPNLTSLDRIDCFPCLKSLDIQYCPLLTRLSPLPPSLVELKLIEVGLTELPGIGGSSSNITPVSLSRLHIKECSSMTSLEQGLLSCNLPKLANVSIKNCRELRRMPVKKLKEFAFLSSLSIVNCPKLMSMAQDDDIHLLLPLSIQTLHLSNCGEVNRSLPGCLHNLTNLTKLELCDCPHFVSLSREALLLLERLKSLHLLNCKELRSIVGLGLLKSLKKLSIRGCPRLQLNGDGQGESICSLVELIVDNYALLRVSPLRNMLPSIKTLKIEDSLEPNMFEGEDQELLRSLTSLRYLQFDYCEKLQSLPAELHTLSSLKQLVVFGCTQIRSLPEKGLPISLIHIQIETDDPSLRKQLDEHRMEMNHRNPYFEP